MSSIASKQALFFALGGVSVAALFVWYIKRDSGKKKQMESNGSAVHQNGSVKQNGHANGSISSGASSTKQPQTADVPVSVQNEKLTIDEKPAEKDEEETDHVAAGDNSRTVEIEQSKSQVEVEDEKQKETEPEQKKPEEEVVIEKSEEPKVEDVQEEQFVKKEEPKLKAAPAAPLKMPTKTKVLEHEQIPEEPTPTKCLGNLSVDIVSPASAFSWSEEMEKSFNAEDFQVNESSDFDRSPASPLRPQNHHYNTHHSAQKKGGSQQKSNRKGGRPAVVGAKDYHHQNRHPQQENLNREVKKGQRRLTKETSVEEKVEKPQKRVVIKTQEAPAPVAAAEPAPQIEVQHQEEGYEKVESPGLDSQNSEASSQDSGRATGPLPSPHDGELTGTDDDYLPMYEFEIPNSLVGLIIGVKGKTIKELSQRTSVRMLIRQHHASDKSKSHQICQVRGKRDEINHCLQMLRRRFPPARFPELNLQPVVPPVLPNSNFDMLSTQPTWLTLPEDIKCEVAVSSIISASHFFIQQPTHPSFASLRHLDMYMISLYGEQSNLPELPVPCNGGLLCAAPVGNSWFRAVTVNYYEDTDEVFVRFVDYGGYSKMARQDLRQIRTDLMSLPFQATEVMLAHVRPVDGTVNWSHAAMEKFTEMCLGKVISCKVVGQYSENQMPMVELYVPVRVGEETHEVRYDQILMQNGLARTADPSKMERKSGLTVNETSRVKRPSFSSQTSQTAVVC